MENEKFKAQPSFLDTALSQTLKIGKWVLVILYFRFVQCHKAFIICFENSTLFDLFEKFFLYSFATLSGKSFVQAECCRGKCSVNMFFVPDSAESKPLCNLIHPVQGILPTYYEAYSHVPGTWILKMYFYYLTKFKNLPTICSIMSNITLNAVWNGATQL